MESFLFKRLIADLDSEYKPIANAKIYLAYDSNGEHPVTGYETLSDEMGFYEIDTKGIPAPRNSYNDYFLIIEKADYHPIKQEMGLGFMSPYISNTAVLKPVAKH